MLFNPEIDPFYPCSKIIVARPPNYAYNDNLKYTRMSQHRHRGTYVLCDGQILGLIASPKYHSCDDSSEYIVALQCHLRVLVFDSR